MDKEKIIKICRIIEKLDAKLAAFCITANINSIMDSRTFHNEIKSEVLLKLAIDKNNYFDKIKTCKKLTNTTYGIANNEISNFFRKQEFNNYKCCGFCEHMGDSEPHKCILEFFVKEQISVKIVNGQEIADPNTEIFEQNSNYDQEVNHSKKACKKGFKLRKLLTALDENTYSQKKSIKNIIAFIDLKKRINQKKNAQTHALEKEKWRRISDLFSFLYTIYMEGYESTDKNIYKTFASLLNVSERSIKNYIKEIIGLIEDENSK